MEAQFGILPFCGCRGYWGDQGWLCPLHLQPKALGTAAAFAGSWDSACAQLSLDCPNSHCSTTHRAPVKGRRGRPRNQLQFVLRIFCNRTRAEPEPLVKTENACELCFLNSELGLEVSMVFNNYCCIWTATLSKHYLSLSLHYKPKTWKEKSPEEASCFYLNSDFPKETINL